MLHTTLNHDGKSPTLSLPGWRIGYGGAVLLRPLHCLLDVVDGEVVAHDRLFMRGQWLPNVHQRSVGTSGHTSLPQIWIRRTKGETQHALVEIGQGVNVVADDFQIVNHVGVPFGEKRGE
jgi:hypothetical protein